MNTIPAITDAPTSATAVFDRLDAFAADQRAALEAGDDDRLLAVLGEKQRLLAAADLPALLRAAPDGEVADLRDRLDALLCDEAEDLSAATARRDAVAGELAALPAAGAAGAAYAAAGEPAARLDVGG